MEASIIAVSLLVGYLIGSISFARVGLRVAGINRDISELQIPVEDAEEDARVEIYGANAASMMLGAKWGIAIGVMDMMKAAVPMTLFRYILYPAEPYYLIVSVAVLLGHNWPLYYGFKGGRGFSVIFGGLVVIDWLAAVMLPLMGILFGLFIAGNMMIGYVGWLFFMPFWLWSRTYDLTYLVYSLIIMILFFISTRPEISTMNRYRNEGKLENYMTGLYESSPRWRGMKRMQDTMNRLGKKRHIIGLFVAAGIILVFLNLKPTGI